MNLYRHYKNKSYATRGIAKHSETLEEYVIYESRYANTEGRHWVRPRTMFEGSVMVDGRAVPRFEKLVLRIEYFESVGPAEEEILKDLVAEILGEWDPRWFHSHLRNHPKILLQLAFVNDAVVGFKLGYELDQWTFYSWLGGVRLEFRGVGVASDLMTAQHEWCRAQKYRVVQTKSQNRWRAQMILNLKHGFDIIGFHASSERGAKITLEKKL